MSRAQGFRLRLLSAVTIGTRRVLAGAELEVDAQTALELVREHRAVLCDPSDLPVLAELAPGLQRANGRAAAYPLAGA